MMKKLILILTAVLITAVSPLKTYAEEAPVPEGEVTAESQAPRVEDLYEYTINTAGRAEITDFKQSDSYKGELIIPQQLDGCDVGLIDNAAFMNAKGITSITIPSTVTDIGNSVFFGCESLERFKVAEGNTYLSVIDDGVLVADDKKFLVAYPAAKSGETYQIPDTIDEIAPGCFGFAKNLKNMTISDKVVYIDSWAFAYSSLEKVEITSKQLDEYAFAYCSNLREVVLNSGVETIEGAAFSNCPALTDVTLAPTLSYIGQFAFAGTGMKDIIIPQTVAELDYGCFGYNSDLKPINGFVIYGKANTSAEAYATASDPENDYENHFEFIVIEDETQPPETVKSEDHADDETVPETIPEEIPEAELKDKIGAELTDNSFLQILLATVGGIAVILAITLIVLSSKKPGKRKQDEDNNS